MVTLTRQRAVTGGRARLRVLYPRLVKMLSEMAYSVLQFNTVDQKILTLNRTRGRKIPPHLSPQAVDWSRSVALSHLLSKVAGHQPQIVVKGACV